MVGEIKFIPRPNQISRMNGALIQGSNDGTNFVTLYTINNITELKWYSQVVTNNTAYRYLRYYTPNGFANVGELEFHEKIMDRTLLALLLSKAAAINANLYTSESVAVLQTAVTSATSVSNKPDKTQTEVDGADQAEIDAASASLSGALKGLQWKDVTASADPGTKRQERLVYVSYHGDAVSRGNRGIQSGRRSHLTVYGPPVTLDTDGTHQVQYRRSVDSGEVKNLEIKIDRTAPVVQITGAASYTIDQDVAITCSATDVVSSVYGAPCGAPLVQAKAYTLPAGQNTVSVTAEDMAGNQTTVTHTFTVTVTFDSLKTVTTSFLQATNAKGWDNVASSLNKLLDQAKAKAAAGQTAAAKDIMADYIGKVTDTGKSFTKAQADYSDPVG